MAAPVHPYSDYGVALRTLKSARSWLSLLLFLCVATQFVGFALMYWTRQPYDEMKPSLKASPSLWDIEAQQITRLLHPTATQKATGTETPQEWFPRTKEGYNLNVRRQWDITYLTCAPITQLLGLISVCSMALLIFITLQVTLVAQAPGVAQMTRSLIWMVLLTFLVFPVQYLAQEFPIPGIFYSYHELLQRVGPYVANNFPEKVYPFQRFLVLVRFIFWPMLGLIVQILSAERFRAGINLAIGHPLQTLMQPRTPAPKPIPAGTPVKR